MTETTETTPSPWTPENVDLLKKLWQDGHTASLIASRIGGTTRNSVIGKVHRLGLAMRVPERRKAPTVIRKPRDKTPERDIIVKVNRPDKPAWQFIPMPTERPRPETLYTLTDRPDNGCMYFYGDPLKDARGYCGEPREPGIAYCGECARICFDVRTPNERQRARAEREKVAA